MKRKKPIKVSKSLRGVLGRRVTVPMFKIVSNPIIPISQIKRRRFNIIERMLSKDVEQEEDKKVFESLYKGVS